MKRSAYLSTGLAIKTLSALSKADIVIHGKERIPKGPTIFVMNHFTRIETILLPYYLYSITDKHVYSLAAANLFVGGLAKFFDLVGVVSTKDPNRDELIIKSLLTNEANWIIFPEGRLVKTKKIIQGNKFMVTHAGGVHKPHTGAAVLALQAEMYRMLIKGDRVEQSGSSVGFPQGLDMKPDGVSDEQITIVPVNLTYYPIRAAENVASNILSRVVKDVPERVLEEAMIEGTMLLSGVDLDVRVGNPIVVGDYLKDKWLQMLVSGEHVGGEYSLSKQIKKEMQKPVQSIMQQYMQDIYSMTTVNHEHLFASFLRSYPFRRVGTEDFKRRVFYCGAKISGNGKNKKNGEFFLHKSLQENQAHLITDDRFKKYENFMLLAKEKEVVEEYEEYLIRDHSKLSSPLSFHRGRIDNPIEVIANEVEPLKNLQSLIRSLSWQPKFLLKLSLARYLWKNETEQFKTDCQKGSHCDECEVCDGSPFLLSHFRRRFGVILIHSYLSVPEEVRLLGNHLRKAGFWVYALRLPGHGTSSEDLSKTEYKEWVETIDTSYALMSCICDNVIVGGIAVGGCLALHLASRVPEVRGAFAVCPPFSLRDYSTEFMPGRDVWNRILSRMKKDGSREFLEFSSGNPHINYTKNPVAGINEIGEYLASIEKSYKDIKQPTLVIQADENPVVAPAGSRIIYDRLGSVDKEYSLMKFDRHVLVNGDRAVHVIRKIVSFVNNLANRV